MDQFQPSDYLKWSRLPDHLAVVFVFGARVVALMHTYIESETNGAPEYLVLDMLAVDQAMQGKGIGAGLVLFADQVARHVSVKEIRLEALTPKLVKFYEDNGYVKIGDPFSSEGWGELHPMRKRL